MRALLIILLLSVSSAWASEEGSFFFDPHVAVGFNQAQGTYLLGGLDLGYYLSEQLAVGVGGYYAAGEHPTLDREFGGGPFATYFQPLTSFLIAQVREDVDYIDQRTPLKDGLGNDVDYVTETGVASITTLALHVRFTPNFGISGGYRAVLSLSNSDLGKNRSGTFLGISIGI
jgi:hypothetical protein